MRPDGVLCRRLAALGALALATAAVPALATPTTRGTAAPGQRDTDPRPGQTKMVSVDGRGRPATAVAPTAATVQDPTGYDADNLTACWMSTTPGSSISDALVNTGPDISADGNHVVFVTSAALVSDDTNRSCDVYEYDRRTGHVARVSVSSSGTQSTASPLTGVASTSYASVSDDGRYVAFASDASGLVPKNQTSPAWNVYVHDVRTGKTVLASISSVGPPSASQTTVIYGSYMPRISGDGHYVVFVSAAGGLVPNQTGSAGRERIYRHDLRTGRTVMVSGSEADSSSCEWVTTDRDGQTVAYGCGGGALYVADMRSGRTRLVVSPMSLEPQTGCGAICDTYIGSIGGQALSGDGRYLVFISEASGLVPNKQNRNLCATPGGRDSADDVFVVDLRTNRIRRVSVDSDGEESLWGGGGGDASCWGGGGGGINNGGSISADGRFVTFRSMTNFFARDTGETTFFSTGIAGAQPGVCKPQTSQACPGDPAAYVYDTVTGTLDWISTTAAGGDIHGSWCATYGSPPVGNNGQSAPDLSVAFANALSGDGRYAVFTSCATDLVPKDHTNQWEVYLRDRGLVLGAGALAATGRLSVAGRPGFASTGVVSATARSAGVSDLIIAEGGELSGVTVAYRAGSQDLFVRESLQSMPPVTSAPLPAPILYGLDVTAAGVRYQVRAQHVLGPDYDAAGGASFGLFREGPGGSWSKIATLRGGYGTTGQEVVFSVPLADLGASNGARLSGMTAFTAVGSYLTGVTRMLDRLGVSS